MIHVVARAERDGKILLAVSECDVVISHATPDGAMPLKIAGAWGEGGVTIPFLEGDIARSLDLPSHSYGDVIDERMLRGRNLREDRYGRRQNEIRKTGSRHRLTSGADPAERIGKHAKTDSQQGCGKETKPSDQRAEKPVGRRLHLSIALEFAEPAQRGECLRRIQRYKQGTAANDTRPTQKNQEEQRPTAPHQVARFDHASAKEGDHRAKGHLERGPLLHGPERINPDYTQARLILGGIVDKIPIVGENCEAD